MVIKILGTGCSKCNSLEKNVDAAIEKLGLDATVDHVRDITEIVGYGVMRTPALVINEKVVSAGKILSVSEVVALLEK